ncbi:MAG: hypothetical protein EXR77_02015 [Myxococcales bacterium]|nr:hypothetical protein [Myxococcales bacterium]
MTAQYNEIAMWHGRRSAVQVQLLTLCGLALAAMSGWGCASEPAKDATAVAAGPTSLRTAQESMPQKCEAKITVCWEAELGKNAELSKISAGETKPFAAAGFVQDAELNRLVWAEFGADGAARTEVGVVWGLCKPDGKTCSAGTATYTATGAQIVDSAGKEVTRIGVGLPVLRKQLKFHAPDKDPTVLAPLSQGHKIDSEEAKAQLAKIKTKVRRFVVLNAFGPQVGLSAAPIVDAAKNSGLYDSVELIDFARTSDVTAVLPTLTGVDALVLLGAGVQEKFTDKPEKPLGMAFSRGIFGDSLLYGKSLGTLLTAPPLGGPSLVVLAGSNSLAIDYFTDKSTLGEGLNSAAGRALIGFGGRVTGLEATAAVAALVTGLAGGATLEASMAAAGQPLLTPMDKAFKSKWLLMGKSAAFWAGKAPSKAAMTIHVKMEPPFCTPPIDPCDKVNYATSYEQTKIPAEQLTAGHATFSCPVLVIDGPWLSCTAKDANSGAEFSLTGVMRGRAKGDRFWLFLAGTANAKYKQMTVVGEGIFEDIDEGGGKTVLRFKGIGAAGPYLDQDNNCCTAGSAALTTIKNEAGQIEIWP